MSVAWWTAASFVLEHAALLVCMLVAAVAAGTAGGGSRLPIALRGALGLAIFGQLFVTLAAFALLRPATIGICIVLALAGALLRLDAGWWRAISWRSLGVVAIVALPFFALTLYPPLAFDEMLYHLPFIRAASTSGELRFLADVRFPIFPQLHEMLSVPAFLALDDVATHLVSLVEVLITGALLYEWGRSRQRGAGLVAAALFLGGPIVVHLATIDYVDAALALFIAAAFFSLDRYGSERSLWPAAMAGLLIGTACSVKYLGWYFAAGALAWLVLFATSRRRVIPSFLLGLLAGVVPMYGRIFYLSGNPLFPYLTGLFGKTPWTIPVRSNLSPGDRILAALRVVWNVAFARERLNAQPPYTPFVLLLCGVVLIAAYRDRRVTFLAILGGGYLLAFTYLPQDSRYLLSLLPLFCVAAAIASMAWLNRQPTTGTIAVLLATLAIAPGFAYAGYRLWRLGLPPLTTQARQHFLETNIPEYRALERRGPGKIYVYGAEQLKYYGGDDLYGDMIGPWSASRILGRPVDGDDLPSTLGAIDVRSVLISRRALRLEELRYPTAPAFELVYADDGAELWRIASH